MKTYLGNVNILKIKSPRGCAVTEKVRQNA